jgi:heptosyltransferase III
MSSKCLVFCIGSVGDTVVSVPAFRMLRRHLPNCELHVLQVALKKEQPLPFEMLRAAGTAEGFLTYRPFRGRGALSAFFELKRAIRQGGYKAVAYVAPAERTPKQVVRDALFFKWVGLTTQFGFRMVPPEDIARPDKTSKHEALMRCERFIKDGLTMDPSDFALPLLGVLPEAKAVVDGWLAEHRRGEKPLWAVALDTNQPAKAWPKERFAEVLTATKARHDIEFVYVGGPQDREDGAAMAERVGGLNACGAFTIPQTVALLDQTVGYFGLDTGPTHLAAAVGKRCVVISSDHNFLGQWEPLGDNHENIRHRVPCGGCQSPVCLVEGHPCMMNIESADVIQRLSRVMGEELERAQSA